MDLSNLLASVTDAITRHNDPNQPQYPQENLVSFVTNLFTQHSSGGGYNNPRPASEDPYGDPGGGGFGGRNVRPASQDSYGDPGAYGGQNVKPASQDPYGDPG